LKKITIKTELDSYEALTEMTQEEQNLMQKAKEACEKAYAPYSKFKVGAALLLENGKIILGNNQENAAYPSGMCAERVAIWKAHSDYPDVKMLKMALTIKSEKQVIDSPVPPCGACRQSIAEYEVKQKTPIEIFFMGEKGAIYKTKSLANLLPLVFDKEVL
jgi:cytidine deaminase